MVCCPRSPTATTPTTPPSTPGQSGRDRTLPGVPTPGQNKSSKKTGKAKCKYCARMPKRPEGGGGCYAQDVLFMNSVLGDPDQRLGGVNYNPDEWEKERGNSGESEEESSDETHISRREMKECRGRLAAKAHLYGFNNPPTHFKYCTGRQKRIALYLLRVFRKIFGKGETGKQVVLPYCVLVKIRKMYKDDERDTRALGDSD